METYGLRSLILLLGFSLGGFCDLKSKASSSVLENFTENHTSYRLPNETRPVSYDILLESRIDKGSFNFTGRVRIVLEVLNETSHVILHARRLEIRSVELTTAYYVPEKIPVNCTYDVEKEFLMIHATESILTPMYYYLTIEYGGELRKEIAGFYRTSYYDENNNTVYIASTQFLTTDARHAFPCYDEPQKKAVFKIAIKHGSNYIALSNMPILQGPIDNNDGTSTTEFQQTSVMSTYLLAFTISNFEYIERIARIPHRIYSRKGTQKENDFALNTSVRTLQILEDYLNVTYKLPKLDNIAIPGFIYAGMESWGLVMYQEETLFFNASQSTTLAQSNMAVYMAHELVHQCFTNLISPNWWTFIWLNNGIPTLLSYVAANAVFPEWNLWQRFHIDVYNLALQADSRINSRPMTHYVESPGEIDSAFGESTYYKGASVINMFQHALQKHVFVKALQYYLEDMEYSSAEEDDLFRSFQKAYNELKTSGNPDVDIYKSFKSWTNQGGFPLLTVTRNYDKGTFIVQQSPFQGTDQVVASDKRSWWVPFNYASANNPDFSDTSMEEFLKFEEKSKEILPNDEESWTNEDWILLNKQSTGYYRINYDADNWKLLINALKDKPQNMHVLNRAQLLDDAYAFVLSKLMNFTTFLDLSTYLRKEIEYAPWVRANSILNEINRYLIDDTKYDLFQYYVRYLVGNFYKEIDVTEKNNDDHLTKLVRGFAVTWACKANYVDCLEKTRSEFESFVQTGEKIEPNMIPTVLCFGLVNATEKEYELILRGLMESNDKAFRSSLISDSLGCMSNKTLLQRYLRSVVQFHDSNNYSIAERTNILPAIISFGSVQFEAAVNFLIDNHAEYRKIPPLYGVPPLISAVTSIANSVVNDQRKNKFEELLTHLKDYAEIQDAEENLKAILSYNSEWNSKHRVQLVEWLDDFRDREESQNGNAAATTSIFGMLIVLLIIFWNIDF